MLSVLITTCVGYRAGSGRFQEGFVAAAGVRSVECGMCGWLVVHDVAGDGGRIGGAPRVWKQVGVQFAVAFQSVEFEGVEAIGSRFCNP